MHSLRMRFSIEFVYHWALQQHSRSTNKTIGQITWHQRKYTYWLKCDASGQLKLHICIAIYLYNCWICLNSRSWLRGFHLIHTHTHTCWHQFTFFVRSTHKRIYHFRDVIVDLFLHRKRNGKSYGLNKTTLWSLAQAQMLCFPLCLHVPFGQTACTSIWYRFDFENSFIKLRREKKNQRIGNDFSSFVSSRHRFPFRIISLGF